MDMSLNMASAALFFRCAALETQQRPRRCKSLVRPPYSLVTPHLSFMYKKSCEATCAPQNLTFGTFIWLFGGFFVHQLP